MSGQISLFRVEVEQSALRFFNKVARLREKLPLKPNVQCSEPASPAANRLRAQRSSQPDSRESCFSH
jgi:hypothetical protein